MRRAVLLTALLALGLASPARANIYFRAAAKAENGSGATTLTISTPSGVVAGDLLIAGVATGATTAPTAPAGWTQITSSAAPFGWSALYWRIASSSEPASYTWTVGASATKAAGSISDYLGASATSPIETSAVNGGFGALTGTAPSITTTTANSLVLVAAAAGVPASFAITPDPTTTDRGSIVTSGSGSAIGVDAADFTQAGAGATPTKTIRFSGTANWATATIGVAPGAGALGFGIAPRLPALPGLTLNARAQTVSAAMGNFDVDDTTGTGAGWNVTVQGNSASGFSPVFKQYCPNAGGCGTDPFGYVAGGQTLPASSLTLSTAGAALGGAGPAPTLQCAAGCTVDTTTPSKIVSAATGAGLGAWAITGLAASSLSLAVPTTVRTLPASEVYRLDVIWTLSSGP